MEYIVLTKRHKEMRNYPEVCDWYDAGRKIITVAEELGSDTGLAVAIHEMVEQYLCERDGIKEEDVSRYDRESKENEPGDNKKAPYHKQHSMALGVEYKIVKALGMSWEKHCKNIDRLFKKSKNKKEKING